MTTNPMRAALDAVAQQLHDDDPAEFHGTEATRCRFCAEPAPAAPASSAVSVVPPATNQAALLRWAADRLDADMERFFTEWPDEPRNSPYALGRRDAAAELRRLAAEAGQAGGPSREATEPQPETPGDDPLRMAEELCPGFPDRCPNLRTIEPEPGVHLGGVRCGCADPAPAVVAQPGKETDRG